MAVMKSVLIIIVNLILAGPAVAETVIVEYPDHYYVESTGSPNEKPAAGREGNGAPARPMPLPTRENILPDVRPEAPGERRAALVNEIQRLQREQSGLMTPREGDTPDQISRKQQDATGKLMKIKRLSSELEKLSVTDQGAK
jgi:hypothetical protein